MFSYLSRPSIIPRTFSILTASNIYRNQQRGFKKTHILRSNTKIYTNNEEWLYETYEATKMGISSKAISELSELVYIEFLHEKGNVINENEDIVVIESVKATDSIKAPYDLVLLGNNEKIEENLEIINNDPENVDTSWFVKIDKIH